MVMTDGFVQQFVYGVMVELVICCISEFLSSIPKRTPKPSISKGSRLKVLEMKAKKNRSNNNDTRGVQANKRKRASGKTDMSNGMADKIISQRKRKEEANNKSSQTRKKRRTG